MTPTARLVHGSTYCCHAGSVLVLVNARARGAARDPMLPDRLRRALGGAGRVQVTWGLHDIRPALQAGRQAGCTTYALCGGDGTTMYGLSELRHVFGRRLPPVLLLPGGTVNTVARSLGLTGGPERILRQLVSRLEGASAGVPSVSHDTLLIEQVGRPETQKVGFIFGAALVSSFFDLYNSAGDAGGRLWAAAQIGRIFLGSFAGSQFSRKVIDPVEVSIRVDGAPSILHRVSLLLASTLQDVGLGLRVTYAAGTLPGTFHVVGTDLPAGRLGPQLPRVLAGRPLKAAHLLDQRAREVLIEFAQSRPYLFDGELASAAALRVCSGPRVRLLVPA